MEPLRETFPVHTYEADAFGTLAVPALAGYLQEIAGLHAGALGVGIETLMDAGLTWVLARERIEMARPMRLGEALEIATWPSGIERLAARREFEVRVGGEIAARATTVWYVLDVATRKPVRPERVLDARFPREPTPHLVALEAGKLPDLGHWELQKRFHVRYEDIDRNQHVTNATYLAWALEAVPRDVWLSSRPAVVEARFIAECAWGSAILSRLVRTGPASFAHAIVHEEDGRELARVVTAWAPREDGGTPLAGAGRAP